MASEIFRKHEHLEPVLFHWIRRTADEMEDRSYKDILQSRLEGARQENKKIRSRTQPYYLKLFHGFGNAIAWFTGLVTGASRDHTRTVYLIDDAVNTYAEIAMWEDLFKNPNPSNTGADLFVLVCVHGSADGVLEWGDEPGQGAEIESHRRIELRSRVRKGSIAAPEMHSNGGFNDDEMTPGSLCMLLSSVDIQEVVKEWTNSHVPALQIGDDLIEYLKFETQGHAGMLVSVLNHLSRMESSDLVLPLQSLPLSRANLLPGSSKFFDI